jgi:hypothetical protein
MDARDISAIGDALAGGLDETTSRVEEIHQAVARRSFGVVGPARRLPEAIHDGISARVYSAVRTVGPAAIRLSALGIGSTRDAETSVHEGPNGRAVIGALNGLVGDVLARRRNALALRMTIRSDGHDVPTTPEGLRAAFPAASPRVALFVHGLGETDDAWRWYARQHWNDPELNYGELLRRELGYTPVYVRFNSGRPVDHSGRELARLLDELYRNWPGGMHQLAIVAHSLGARVAHDAVYAGYLADSRWVDRLTHVFALGTPGHAERAERATQATGRALSRLPETRPIATMLEARSPALKAVPQGELTALPPGIAGVRLPAGPERISHFKLLNHPAIYQDIKAELSARTGLERAPAARGVRFERAARALRSRRRSPRR